ncbi:alanine racemase [Methylothermus subterraneus]
MNPPFPYALLNLDALRANLERVRALAPRSKVLAVIKANAYGHGLVQVAHALHAAHGFAVARVDEGIALRQAGVLKRIVVLQGFLEPEQLKAHWAWRLEPVIHTLSQIDLLEANGPTRQPLRIWLKLDSGMHRLGLTPQEFNTALARLKRLFPPRALALMTHLACADEPDNPATAAQLTQFAALTAGLNLARSIANSAAILTEPASHGDWVRPGLMLYGVSPFANRSARDLGLTPVMSLKSRVIAIKTVAKGEAVGYGGSWIAPRVSRLGIVAAGYGDGYPREVAPEAKVLIEGRRVPVVGRVSMDTLQVDLTDFPEVPVGAEAILWGEGLPVEEVARWAGTIPYTLLSRVAARVPKIEFQTSYEPRQNRL